MSSEPVLVAEYEFEYVSVGDSAVVQKDGHYVAATVSSVKHDDMGLTDQYEVCTFDGKGSRSEEDFQWVDFGKHVRVYESFGNAAQYAEWLNA